MTRKGKRKRKDFIDDKKKKRIRSRARSCVNRQEGTVLDLARDLAGGAVEPESLRFRTRHKTPGGSAPASHSPHGWGPGLGPPEANEDLAQDLAIRDHSDLARDLLSQRSNSRLIASPIDRAIEGPVVGSCGHKLGREAQVTRARI